MKERFDQSVPISITHQAAAWLVRLVCGGLTVAERYEYLQWLKVSPVHIAELLRMCRIYMWLDAAKLQPAVANEDNYSNVVELPARETAPRVHRAQRPVAWHGRIAAALAAMGLAVLLGVVVNAGGFNNTIATEASEWRHLTLSDGSVVSIGPRTRLRDQFDAERRNVHMLRGEAVFHVAKDPSRPFEVDADVLIVRATGTQFAVDRRGDEVIVTVAEGSVEILRKNGSGASAAVAMYAGDQMKVSNDWHGPVRQVDVGRVLAWKHRRLIFERETIQEAVEQFNRRNRVQLVVDPALGARQVRGGFNADDPESFAATLADKTNGSVLREGRHVLRVEAGMELY